MVLLPQSKHRKKKSSKTFKRQAENSLLFFVYFCNCILVSHKLPNYEMLMNKDMQKQKGGKNVTNIAPEPSDLYNGKLISMSISL